MEYGDVFGEDRGYKESNKHAVLMLEQRLCKASSDMVQTENEILG